MPLRISLDWLTDYIELPEPAERLAELLTLSGTEVERIVDLGVGWDGVVVARILEAPLVEGSDHLRALQLEVGAERVQVLSGAPNVAVGDLVALARPGIVLPNGVKVGVRKFMHTTSDGMACSGVELGISAEADGLLVLGRDGPTGDPLSELMPPDRVLVLETTTNRPDLLCHLGIARELSALLDRPIREWHGDPVEGGNADAVGVEVVDDDLAARYQARYLDGLTVGPSPPWMQRRLRAVGQKPISNAVDAANYVMLEMGQPLHVFDADRLDEGIVVRRARAGESIDCLDGRTRSLEPEMLAIADRRRPVAIAGIIGGADSAVSASTTRVVVESANFLGTSVRATSRRLGLRTEASTRFEKQLHPDMVPIGAARLAELLQDVAGAGPVSPPVDVYTHQVRIQPIHVQAGFVGATLGDEVATDEVTDILHRLRFRVEADGDELVVTPPPFRLDVGGPIDLVEEVGRIRGYNSLPSTLPGRRLPLGRVLAPTDPEWPARDLAMGAGFDEVITQSFAAVDDPDIGIFPRERLRLANPMSLDQQTLRTSLLPGLTAVVAKNLAWGIAGARVFELARVFWPAAGQELPVEARVLGFAIQLGAGARQVSAGAVRGALLELKGVLEMAADRLSGLSLDFEQVPVGGLHPGRSLVARLDGVVVGCLGLVEPQLADRLDCGVTVVGEINFETLAAKPRVPRPEAISRFPEVVRDIALSVPGVTPARDVIDEIAAVGEVILRSVEVYDEYRGSQVAAGRKGLTLRLTFQARDRTLRGDEAAAAESRILAALATTTDARLRE